MSRIVLSAIFLVAFSARAATEERGQLDASPTLFTVMAAMDAAGYGIDAASPSNHPLRAAVRAEIAKRNVPCLPELKKYFSIHRMKNDTLEFGQYVSWSVTASSPPEFNIRQRDVDLAPDVTPLSDFGPLLATFYKEAGIQDLWRRSQPHIEQYLVRYHAGVMQSVLEVNTYLRQQTSGFRGRHFQVFVELLGPPNQIQTRSYGNEYTIVLTPTAEPQLTDVRHAYLHYLLDPLATRSQEMVMRKRGLGDHAMRAPALPENFKQDFLLLTTECLIKAVEAKLDKRPAEVEQALIEGYILTPYFSGALPAYEKQEQAMQFYFPDMVKAIELKKEDARLKNVEFAVEARQRQARIVQQAPPPPASGAAKTLENAEQLYKARDYDKAREEFLKVLQQTDDKPVQAKAYYGLARVAALQKDPELAERLFQKVLDSSPEPQEKAWAMVYLGRLAQAAAQGEEHEGRQTEAATERAKAAKLFREALDLPGASDMAREAARQGVQQTSKP